MEIASHVESCTLPLVLTNDDGNLINIEIRPDGYVNATKLCQAMGKFWKHYNSNDKTKEFLAELSKVEKIPVETHSVGKPTEYSVDRVLVQIGTSKSQHTWVHPDVAIHLAQWASPRFGVAVSRLVRRYQTGQVTTNESINASVELAKTVSVVDDGSCLSVNIVSGSVATLVKSRRELARGGNQTSVASKTRFSGTLRFRELKAINLINQLPSGTLRFRELKAINLINQLPSGTLRFRELKAINLINQLPSGTLRFRELKAINLINQLPSGTLRFRELKAINLINQLPSGTLRFRESTTPPYTFTDIPWQCQR